MKEYASLHNQNRHHLSRQKLVRGRGCLELFLSSGSDQPLACKLDNEGEEEASDDDGRGDALEIDFPHTFITEHEGGMGIELKKQVSIGQGGTEDEAKARGPSRIT